MRTRRLQPAESVAHQDPAPPGGVFAFYLDGRNSRLLTERPFGFLAQFPFSARGRIGGFVHVNDKVAGD